MTISEKKSIYKIPLASLYGKFQEHEMELNWLEKHELGHGKLEKHEEREVKLKSITLKSKHDIHQEEESQFEDDEDNALINFFEIFLRKEKTQEISQR